MTDLKKMPVDGGGVNKGKPDGVSGSPDSGKDGQVNGRSAGGESGGGAYPNPHSGKAPDNSGFLGHGGQTEIAYHGPSNANAPARSMDSEEPQSDVEGKDAPEARPRPVRAEGQQFEVIEDNGVAAAEATGKVATDAPYEREQESPGAG